MATEENRQDCSLISFLSIIPDPRQEWKRQHPLVNVLIISVCAAICGAETWADIEDFGDAKREWFEGFLDLKYGIPSHDTFRRVFLYLDPNAFHEAFYAWVSSVNEDLLGGDQIAIDGKTLRRSFDRASEKSAIHMVNAWSHSASLVLGQVKTETKSNEITAIPKLLDLLNINGCIVSIDAMGCQKEIAEKIIKKGGDYLLALKANHKYLYERVKKLFESSHQGGHKAYEIKDYEETSTGHGRHEIRRTRVLTQKEGKVMGVNVNHKWPELISVIRSTSERIDLKTGVVAEQTRYFISSAAASADEFARRIRCHWEIENKLHWSLDVQLREDECRKRSGHSAENFSTLRHLALNLVKSEPTKRSVRGKQKKAGWSEEYLLKVLLNDGKSSLFHA